MLEAKPLAVLCMLTFAQKLSNNFQQSINVVTHSPKGNQVMKQNGANGEKLNLTEDFIILLPACSRAQKKIM